MSFFGLDEAEDRERAGMWPEWEWHNTTTPRTSGRRSRTIQERVPEGNDPQHHALRSAPSNPNPNQVEGRQQRTHNPGNNERTGPDRKEEKPSTLTQASNTNPSVKQKRKAGTDAHRLKKNHSIM
jgi:hypothetical protein